MLESWTAVRDPAATALVFGVLKHKDLVSMFSVLKQFSPGSLTLVEAESHEAQSLAVMQQVALDAGLPAKTAEDVEQAVRESTHRTPNGSTLLFGSHYVVGAFLRGGTKK
jgi:folylpolyglutamate synthase/dihydropteroate synthase